jgi:hypothetical protein
MTTSGLPLCKVERAFGRSQPGFELVAQRMARFVLHLEAAQLDAAAHAIDQLAGSSDADIGADQRHFKIFEKRFVDDAAGEKPDDVDARLRHALLEAREPAARCFCNGAYHRFDARKTSDTTGATRCAFYAASGADQFNKGRASIPAMRIRCASSADSGSARRCLWLRQSDCGRHRTACAKRCSTGWRIW